VSDSQKNFKHVAIRMEEGNAPISVRVGSSGSWQKNPSFCAGPRSKGCSRQLFRVGLRMIYLHVCKKRFRLERDLCRKIPHSTSQTLERGLAFSASELAGDTTHVDTRLTASRQFPTECRLRGRTRRALSKAGKRSRKTTGTHRSCSSCSVERVLPR
jgi:hypothetical protein